MEDTAVKLESKESRVQSLKSQDSSITPRILIKSPNWVGDVVLSIPAIKALRDLYPDSYIAVLVKKKLVDLLENNPDINEVIPYKEEKGIKKLSMIGRLGRTIRMGNFDTAILFPNSFSSALIAFLADIPCRVGYGSDCRSPLLTNPIKVKDENKSIHQVHLYLNIIKEVTEVENLQYVSVPKVYIKEEVREWAGNLLNSKIKRDSLIIGINPGAKFGPAKRWLNERFVELGSRLTHELGASLILFGDKGEKDFVSGIASQIKHDRSRVLNMAGSTSLGQLAALIERCNIFITNDTGPMHIAYSVRTPLVAIFGSTDPVRTGPLGNKYMVLKKDIPCSPCFKRICPFEMECMKMIKVEDVMNAVKSLIGD